MSVIAAHIPGFLAQLALRDHENWRDRPLVLLDAEGRVCAATPDAAASGVALEMRPQQARARCPDARVEQADAQACLDAQAAFAHALGRWDMPLELAGWGGGYLDMHTIEPPSQRKESVTLCADLGRAVRAELGPQLQPAIGWDTGKFTARLAALAAHAGHLRVVPPEGEERFLEPLPVTMLPLPAPALLQLGWLGIRTLGQYARLPREAVQQRYGAPGLLAQEWARGRDRRPVQPGEDAARVEVEVEFDAPVEQAGLILEALMRRLRPELDALAAQMAGARQLRVALRLQDGARPSATRALLEPTADPERVSRALEQLLVSLTLSTGALNAGVGLSGISELAVGQLSLWPELDAQPRTDDALDTFARRFARKHGAPVRAAEIDDAAHPAAERRFRVAAVGS